MSCSLVTHPDTNQLYRQIGHAHVSLVKAAGSPVKTHALAGRLYFSRSGWLLMSVPNALGRGAFDALDEAGAELPVSESSGLYNAHVSVMRPEEVEQIGGADKITERGHSYRYTLGAVKEVEPKTWGGVSKVWYIEVESPDLKELRRSYGLTPLPHDNEFEFHVTFAIRKTRVLQGNEVSKAAAWGDGKDPRKGCTCPNCGGTNTTGARATQKFADGTWDFANAVCSDCENGFSFDTETGESVKKTTGSRGQKQAALISLEDLPKGPYTVCGKCGSPNLYDSRCVDCGSTKTKLLAKKAANRPVPEDWNAPSDREDCPSCGAMHERGDGYCNSCGARWPAVTSKAASTLVDLLTSVPAESLLDLLTGSRT